MRRPIAVISIFAMIVSFLIPCRQAYGFDAEKHDEYMCLVLFGDETYTSAKDKRIKENVKLLEYASYLAIDQYNDKGADKLSYLKNAKVKRLPKFESIDFPGNWHHRSYTHRGWNFSYLDDKANWSARKDILRATANKIFDFGFFNEWFGKYCATNDAFCELVYYIHILGDHLASTSSKTEDLIIPCARNNYGDSNPDILYDLKTVFGVLFADQKNTYTYSSFIDDFDALADKMRTLAGSVGGITEEKFEEYHQYEEDLMNMLIDNIPDLLKKEKFFKKAFY